MSVSDRVSFSLHMLQEKIKVIFAENENLSMPTESIADLFCFFFVKDNVYKLIEIFAIEEFVLRIYITLLRHKGSNSVP